MSFLEEPKISDLHRKLNALIEEVAKIEKALAANDFPPCHTCGSTKQKIVQLQLQTVCDKCNIGNHYYSYSDKIAFGNNQMLAVRLQRQPAIISHENKLK